MEQASLDITEITAKETWTIEDYNELVEQLFATTDATSKFREIAADIESQNPSPQGGAAMKVGIARYILCRYDGALEALAEATDNKDRWFFTGKCYRDTRQYDKAVDALGRAKSKGWEGSQPDVMIIEALAMNGQTDQAAAALKKLESTLGESSDFFYLTGLLQELAGQGEEAIENYEKARQEEVHPEATFRLAYYLDLHGQEEEALDLYEECLAKPPVYANALLNMAVLHEDEARYDQAVSCLKKFLAICPNHPRARLFLRDVSASTDMYYDEDQARRIAKHNAVLDIPVTDFELSVRARNCLKKMNIGTLGDLVRTSEPDLLGYKNFGETSLKEIKEMLTAKNLRLGQYADDSSIFELMDSEEAGEASTADDADGTRSKLVSQIEFSVRARRVLSHLGVNTIGELADKSEAELMSIKNFGQTSLSELRQRLSELGLSFRNS